MWDAVVSAILGPITVRGAYGDYWVPLEINEAAGVTSHRQSRDRRTKTYRKLKQWAAWMDACFEADPTPGKRWHEWERRQWANRKQEWNP